MQSLFFETHIIFILMIARKTFKLSCDRRFQRAFTAGSCVFKVITLVWANQRNFFENATTWSKRMHKTLVATQLYFHQQKKKLIWRFDLCQKFLSSFIFCSTVRYALCNSSVSAGHNWRLKLPLYYKKL